MKKLLLILSIILFSCDQDKETIARLEQKLKVADSLNDVLQTQNETIYALSEAKKKTIIEPEDSVTRKFNAIQGYKIKLNDIIGHKFYQVHITDTLDFITTDVYETGDTYFLDFSNKNILTPGLEEEKLKIESYSKVSDYEFSFTTKSAYGAEINFNLKLIDPERDYWVVKNLDDLPYILTFVEAKSKNELPYIHLPRDEYYEIEGYQEDQKYLDSINLIGYSSEWIGNYYFSIESKDLEECNGKQDFEIRITKDSAFIERTEYHYKEKIACRPWSHNDTLNFNPNPKINVLLSSWRVFFMMYKTDSGFEARTSIARGVDDDTPIKIIKKQPINIPKQESIKEGQKAETF
ncbi:hypothetical protein [Aquimarina sp. RZ0]|uniref:hypothetical protein n=1 Tax=Aquimarina sp. RZ0 TaxID=2607730 RepID=UPI0011F1A754|nr:hypothetical protein [Aquimarina sp. RZ0]KAA1244034.1 hypothetical protein F0000_18540 [Aquimarina sp. RZ0]